MEVNGDFSVFIALCGCCSWQRGPAVSLWRVVFCLRNSLGCLGISLGPPCPAAQLNENKNITQTA